jgi:hypothetical protein
MMMTIVLPLCQKNVVGDTNAFSVIYHTSKRYYRQRHYYSRHLHTVILKKIQQQKLSLFVLVYIMFSSLRDTTLRDGNNRSSTNTRSLFPRPHFLDNVSGMHLNDANNSGNTSHFQGKYISRQVTKKISVRTIFKRHGDENNNYQSNTLRENNVMKSITPKKKGTPSSSTKNKKSSQKKKKHKRRQSFSFNKQKSEVKQANYYEKQMQQESKKIAEKYMETGSTEKLKKYIAIKNNTMSPFKKELLKRNGKPSSYDIKEIESLKPVKTKPTAAQPSIPTFTTSKNNEEEETFRKKEVFKANLNAILSTPRKTNVPPRYASNIVNVKHIKKETKAIDQKDVSSSDEEESDTDSSVSDISSNHETDEEIGEDVQVIMVKKSNTERAVSLLEKYSIDRADSETNSSSSQDEEGNYFDEHLIQEEGQQKAASNANVETLNTPVHYYDDIYSNGSMSSPAESDDLSSSSVSSDNSSTYSNSPITLGLFRRDGNGDLQHKVVVKNVKKNAAEKLQNWAKSCLQRKRFHQYVFATICLQKHFRQRFAHSRFLKLKHRHSCAIICQRFLSSKVQRVRFLNMKKAANYIISCYRRYKIRKNICKYLSALAKLDEAREIARQAMENLEASKFSVALNISESDEEENDNDDVYNNEQIETGFVDESSFDSDENGEISDTNIEESATDIQSDIEEDELSEISEVDDEATEISIDLTVENAVKNVIKQIDSKPLSVNVSFENAVNNVENRVGRLSSVSDNFTTASITGYVNEAEGYTNYKINIEDTFNTLRQSNNLSNYNLQSSPKKTLVIKRRYNDFFQFDKELILKFDKNSYGIPSLPPKTWCRNMSEGFVTRRAVDLNNYIKIISKENDIVSSKIYQNFINVREEK